MKHGNSITAHTYYCAEGTCTRGVMFAGQRCGLHQPDTVTDTQTRRRFDVGPQTIKAISNDYQISETKTAAVGDDLRDTAKKYPKYYKQIPDGVTHLDVYAVCDMFPVDDATGCINHARKKLLVPGVRSGGKSFRKDIEEARDTLNRYLELTKDEATSGSVNAETTRRIV